MATKRGLPMVFLGESSGARMPDHMGSRGMGLLLIEQNVGIASEITDRALHAALGYEVAEQVATAAATHVVIRRRA